ncbi:MAG: hypothetical protein PHQ43_13055 [Dehalococcoidales bacterium]|nr:hypothetical protein [Dehalococcoidales bacterium]
MELRLLIDDLDGEVMEFTLEDIGNCYPSDDVIYIDGMPCKLSTARAKALLKPTESPSALLSEEEICRCLCETDGKITPTSCQWMNGCWHLREQANRLLQAQHALDLSRMPTPTYMNKWEKEHKVWSWTEALAEIKSRLEGRATDMCAVQGIEEG